MAGSLLVSAGLKLENEEMKKKHTCVLKWVELSCGPHWPQSFKWLKLWFVGPGWDRRRRVKWSSKNLVLKKSIFLMICKYRKLCTVLVWKVWFAIFPRKTWFLWFEFKLSKHKSCRVKHDKSKQVVINIFKIKDKFPLGHASHGRPRARSTQTQRLSKFPKAIQKSNLAKTQVNHPLIPFRD